MFEGKKLIFKELKDSFVNKEAMVIENPTVYWVHFNQFFIENKTNQQQYYWQSCSGKSYVIYIKKSMDSFDV